MIKKVYLNLVIFFIWLGLVDFVGIKVIMVNSNRSKKK